MESIRNDAEDGYTLLETVAAMSLFLGVLLPFLALLGNLSLDQRALSLEAALNIAQVELSRWSQVRPASTIEEFRRGNFLLQLSRVDSGHFVVIRVRVLKASDPSRTYFDVEKAVLSSE